MNVLFVPLCCVGLVLPMALGLGISFYAERFLGRRAYVVGWLVPIFIFVTLYGLYHLWLRLLSCTPVNRLICGEPFLYIFLLFTAVLAILMLANGASLFALYLFFCRRDAPLFNEVGSAEPSAMAESSEIRPPDPNSSEFESIEPVPPDIPSGPESAPGE